MACWLYHPSPSCISPFVGLFLSLSEFIEPLTTPITDRSSAPDLAVDALVITLLLFGCFVVGTAVTTGVGKWLHKRFDRTLATLAPGYNLVKDILHQFFGDGDGAALNRAEVARVKLFGVNVATTVTAIVTSRHPNNDYTVFVPTGPNPTSGMIYHLPPEQVEILTDVKVDDAMRTIIACGAGSGDLFYPIIERR